ncbi:MAG: FlgD immunoglobulin-like domain containing protein [bacterium]|nr:FlgD immunoglobulin-like domain containing protein [bacterium]
MCRRLLRCYVRAALLLLVTLPLPALAGQIERVLLPTPPGGGVGTSILPSDDAMISGPRRGEPRDEQPSPPMGADKDLRYEVVGGDDVLAYASGDDLTNVSLDIAANGDLYAAVEADIGTSSEIRILRSTDGGGHWSLWATLTVPGSNASLTDPWLRVAEGNQNRCYVAYVLSIPAAGISQVHVTWSTLGLAAGSFATDLTVMSQAGVTFDSPRFATDAVSFANYYLYLVATGYDAAGADIWYARSVDYGATFEGAYQIASLTNPGLLYVEADVSYGFGGYVHVVWEFRSADDSFDAALRHRRASSYGGGGIGSWNTIIALSGTTNGIWERQPRIAASSTGNEVVVVHDRATPYSPGYLILDPGTFASTNQGLSFPSSAINVGGLFPEQLEHRAGDNIWLLAGNRFDGFAVQRATAAAPTSWSQWEEFADADYSGGYTAAQDCALALDPAHDQRIAMIKSVTRLVSAGTDSLMFDAEWRRDPGYPNLVDGFPRVLSAEPISDPAIVDLDGDGLAEIVFSDAGGAVHAVHNTGADLPGWPVATGAALSEGPVAVGALDLSGELSVVVGTIDGRVFAFAPDGSPRDGWPYQMPAVAPVFVSIGAVGGPYPRSVVAVGGAFLRILDSHGTHVPSPWGWNLTGAASYPAAIGNIDADPAAEIVCTFGSTVWMFDRITGVGNQLRTLPAPPSEAVSLGDLDLDGDAEVLVPTSNGTLYAVNSNGTEQPGSWPFVSASASPLSRPAIANCLGMPELEVAVAARSWSVHLLKDDGLQQAGFPVGSDGWLIYGSPILGMLEDGTSADVVFGARGNKAWAWSNLSALLDGWPKELADSVYQTPAMGDLDGDGLPELVFLGTSRLYAYHVNQSAGYASRTWLMYGYDPARTGCANCPEDVTTAVGDGGGVTRVSFAPPSPNPVSGDAVFAFATPVRSVVELVVHDLRGRRVRTVTRTEIEPGSHVVGWDGRDDEGRPLSSGQYLATLQVRGPGLDQSLTRKLSVVH